MQKENLFFFSFPSAKNFGEARVTKNESDKTPAKGHLIPVERFPLLIQ